MIKSLTRFALPFLFISPFHFVEAAEDEQASYADNFLFGGWGGSRARMADDGMEFEFILTSDFYNLDYYDSTTNQQESKNVSLYNADLTMTIDAEKKWGMDGATFFFYILGNWGDKPSEFVGDTQVFDNIETIDAWKLYEAWYQQSFSSEKLSLLFGLFDLNSEFDVIESAGLFSNSSHGIGKDFSQSGLNGPSIFATTSLSLRLAYNITDQTYLQGVVMDGVPGDPLNNPKGTGVVIKLDSEDGLLTAFELGHVSADDAPYHKFSLGYWGYSKANVADIADGNDIKNSGVYAAADGTVFQETGDPAQGLNIFVRYGFVNEDKINDVTTYTGAGMVYTGLIPGRDEDQFGIAIAIAEPTDEFKSGEAAAEAETALIFTYYAPITSWLSLKPDIQLISNPGMVNNKADATVIGVRAEISF
jgi:porin